MVRPSAPSRAATGRPPPDPRTPEPAAGRLRTGRPEAGLRRRVRVSTVYSHSRLSSFENCPKQFHYRYVERRAVDLEGIEAFVGKRVHEVLERLNQFVERGLVPSLAKVVGRFRAEWEQHFDPTRVRIVRADDPPEVYRENGERCLTHHYRSSA